MNEQIQYITALAAQYKIYAEQPEELFAAVNQLSETAIKSIFDEYGDSERFQPVNLLRAEVARQLLDGIQISKEKVEEIKEKIRVKDLGFFTHLPAELLSQLENYPIGGRDMFANWQKDWNVFHTFFYRGKVKETVQIYLEQICKRLLNDLQLNDYKSHWVDFQGSNNFGAFWCWIALYPQNKSSHKEARQFFLKFKPEIEVGRIDGSNVEAKNTKLKLLKTMSKLLKSYSN